MKQIPNQSVSQHLDKVSVWFCQLSVLTTSDVEAGKDLGSVQRSIRQSFWGSYFKWSNIKGSGLKSLTICCPNPSLLKGFKSGSHRSPLVPYQFWGANWCWSQ